MIEDTLLLHRFKRGSRQALQDIYQKYRAYLLTLATALLQDVNAAEDILHDFFVSFAQSGRRLKADGNLKWYLVTCVANRARDRIRADRRRPVSLDHADSIRSNAHDPETSAICNEEMQRLLCAIDQLPYEQREVLVLHARGRMKFKMIARLQNVSIKTVQSRYRYGLDKLRVALTEVKT